MKIAVFYNLPFGGAKRLVEEQIKYLSRKNRVDIYQITDDKKLAAKKDLVNRYYFNLGNYFFYPFSRIYSDWKNFVTLSFLHKKIAKEIDSKKYDLILVHPDILTQSPFLLRYLKTKTFYYCEEWLRIIYEKEFFFQDRVNILNKWYEKLTRTIRKKIDKKNILSADKIITNSKFTTDNIKKAYGLKSEIVYPGVDTKLFKPMNIKKEYDLFYIAFKSKFEGFDLLENVIPGLGKKIKIKIIDRKKDNSFKLTDSTLVKEYNKSKIVLSLSINDPFGMAVLEAAACQVPVIAIDEGAYKESVVNGKTGLLVKRKREDLISAIKFLLNNKEKREDMGKKARERVQAGWTWEKHGEKLLKIIRKA